MKTYNILVAIPVFNETDVRSVVLGIKNFPLDILVIDDGSNNGLKEKLSDIGYTYLITHPRNLGYGKALIDAFTFGIRNRYDYIITIDGDGQHEPEEIQLFLNEIPFSDCDILSGSRYLLKRAFHEGIPPERYRINRRITYLINSITGFNLTDAFCGFKAYKVEKLKLLRLTEYGYGMPLQLWIQAWRRGLRVRETPVKLIYKDATRQFGGMLNDPEARLRYYNDAIEDELMRSEQNGISMRKVRQTVGY